MSHRPDPNAGAPLDADEPVLDVHLGPDDLRATMREDIRRGLTSTPKQILPKYLYDARGSELFEQITRLPEYYPTRAERSILTQAAGQIAATAHAQTLVELGSGSSEKTRLLLNAMRTEGRLDRYVPVDVSASALTGAMSALQRDYPGLAVHGVVADFETHLDRLPDGGRRMVAFLGSTIGNLNATERDRFLSMVRGCLNSGDTLLLGTDLVKDPTRLVAAYDDASGITAQFNRNILTVLNREVHADFPVARFAHVARWNAAAEQIEMWLRCDGDLVVAVQDLDLTASFTAGEEMLTEISVKFQLEGVRTQLAKSGFDTQGTWTDADGDFALTLAATLP